MPLLSIIIPVYNLENYLEDCLNSIINQNFYDYEVILVDDVSTDESGNICNRYAEKYFDFKVIHLKTKGLPAGARNIGIQNASGKYVHFCDGDDYYLNNSFDLIRDNLIKNKPDVLIGQFICKPEKGAFYCEDVLLKRNIFIENNTEKILQYFLSLNNLTYTPWRFILNREFIIKNNLYFLEGYHVEDEEWFPKVICTANNFSLLAKPFYCYRPRLNGSITSQKTYLHTKAHIVISLRLLNFLYNKRYEYIKKHYIMLRVKFLIGLFSTRCDTLHKNQIKELAQIIDKNIKYFNLLKEISQRGDLFDFVNRYGSCVGLSLYRTYIIEKTIEKIYGNEDKKIYIFPTGYNGEGTARILKNAGYKVEGFLDNSNTKNGCIIDDLEVNLPSILKNIDDEKLSNIFIVISTQKRQVVEILRNQLKSLNIKENQFAIRIY